MSKAKTAKSLTVVPPEPNGKITRIENTALSPSVPFSQLAVSVFSERQYEILNAPTPDYAIKHRDGPGGRTFPYLKTAYVEMKLTEAFGGDWDWRLIPVAENRLYVEQIMERERVNKKTGAKETIKERHLGAIGALTVRIRDPKTLKVIAEITKYGVGSQVYNENTELFDNVKGADSDALKRAARKFGIGRDLAWNDDEERAKYERTQELANTPTTVAELPAEPRTLLELMAKANMSPDLIAQLLNVTSAEVLTWTTPEKAAEAWAKIQAAKVG